MKTFRATIMTFVLLLTGCESGSTITPDPYSANESERAAWIINSFTTLFNQGDLSDVQRVSQTLDLPMQTSHVEITSPAGCKTKIDKYYPADNGGWLKQFSESIPYQTSVGGLGNRYPSGKFVTPRLNMEYWIKRSTNCHEYHYQNRNSISISNLYLFTCVPFYELQSYFPSGARAIVTDIVPPFIVNKSRNDDSLDIYFTLGPHGCVESVSVDQAMNSPD